jgi:hypothetical protein
MTPFPKIALPLVALTLLSGCDLLSVLPEPPGGYDRLSMEQRPYHGDALRLNGFYAGAYASDGREPGGSVYFFYRNGAVRYVGTFNEDLTTITHDDFSSEKNNDRSHWGLFQVDGDRIAFERWYPANKGYRQAHVRAGHLLNDSTFVITESWRSTGGERRAKDETYHFHPFHPKPDSTSRFLP